MPFTLIVGLLGALSCRAEGVAPAGIVYADSSSAPRILISDDGRRAILNRHRIGADDLPAAERRARLLLARGTPVEPAHPLTPLMGWSSWNTFAEHISEDIIVGIGEAMATNSLKEAGYVYVNIDDGFFDGHGPDGKLRFNPVRFPFGLKRTVERLHALGLKAGTYSDAGRNTCASYGGDASGRGAGLYGYDQADCALFFNELGFDFIKVDYCGAYHQKLEEKKRYCEIAHAIRMTGRTDVRMNICRWAFPGTWAASIAGSWRTTRDIRASWESIRGILAENLYLSAYARPGAFNDLDMLEVGHYKGSLKSAFGHDGDKGLTPEEEATHFGMWCLLSSPLVLGCDVRSLPQTTLRLVTNPYLLKMNQNPLGLQAYVVKREGATYQLVKDAETRFGRARYVALYNAEDRAREFRVDAADFDLSGRIEVFDLAARADLGAFRGEWRVKVPAHGARFYLFDAEKRLERRVYEAETAYLTDYSEIDETSYGSEASAALQGRAYWTTNAMASGSVAIVNLGARDSNDLIWKEVKTFTAGMRRLTFRYSSPNERSFLLQIDGGAPRWIKTPATGDAFRSVDCAVDLSAGVHTLRLSNPWAPMPDVDCLTVDACGRPEMKISGLQGASAEMAEGKGNFQCPER